MIHGAEELDTADGPRAWTMFGYSSFVQHNGLCECLVIDDPHVQSAFYLETDTPSVLAFSSAIS